jgi:hypothetical protein
MSAGALRKDLNIFPPFPFLEMKVDPRGGVHYQILWHFLFRGTTL